MKKIVLVVIALAVFQKWGDISNFLNPPPDFGAAYDGKVILYATAWCGYCKKVRELLEENGIPYHEYDIEKSSVGREQYKRLGGKGVPVLLIGDVVVKGYNPSKILKLAGK
jgi:mycoredoxin